MQNQVQHSAYGSGFDPYHHIPRVGRNPRRNGRVVETARLASAQPEPDPERLIGHNPPQPFLIFEPHLERSVFGRIECGTYPINHDIAVPDMRKFKEAEQDGQRHDTGQQDPFVLRGQNIQRVTYERHDHRAAGTRQSETVSGGDSDSQIVKPQPPPDVNRGDRKYDHRKHHSRTEIRRIGEKGKITGSRPDDVRTGSAFLIQKNLLGGIESDRFLPQRLAYGRQSKQRKDEQENLQVAVPAENNRHREYQQQRDKSVQVDRNHPSVEMSARQESEHRTVHEPNRPVKGKLIESPAPLHLSEPLADEQYHQQQYGEFHHQHTAFQVDVTGQTEDVIIDGDIKPQRGIRSQCESETQQRENRQQHECNALYRSRTHQQFVYDQYAKQQDDDHEKARTLFYRTGRFHCGIFCLNSRFVLFRIPSGKPELGKPVKPATETGIRRQQPREIFRNVPGRLIQHQEQRSFPALLAHFLEDFLIDGCPRPVRTGDHQVQVCAFQQRGRHALLGQRLVNDQHDHRVARLTVIRQIVRQQVRFAPAIEFFAVGQQAYLQTRLLPIVAQVLRYEMLAVAFFGTQYIDNNRFFPSEIGYEGFSQAMHGNLFGLLIERTVTP